MSDHIVQTISDLEKKVQEYEANSLRVKITINELCQMAGLPPRYPASSLEKSSVSGITIRSDQFHARPLATIVREYLEMRKNAGLGPALLEDVFEALAQGGYESQAKEERIAKIALYNALTKNPIFYRLPNKHWGLLEWYPKAKQRDDESDNERTERRILENAPKGSEPASIASGVKVPQRGLPLPPSKNE
jgi:hypothetical protein